MRLVENWEENEGEDREKNKGENSGSWRAKVGGVR